MSSANPHEIPEQTLEVRAGEHPNGEAVFERLLVCKDPEGGFTLIKSPLFVRGIARGDSIVMNESGDGGFTIRQRRGNLCIRIFRREGVKALEENLTIAMEKLGGDLDICHDNALVYSIHFGVGFTEVEKLLNESLPEDAQWLYGNVYDPVSGEPLNWWQDLYQV